VHNHCFSNQVGLSLKRTALTCCLDPPTTQVCSTPLVLPPPLYEDNWVGGHALGMLKKRPSNQPWFMQINWPGPHPPFIVNEEMIKRTANKTFPLPQDYTVDENTHADNIEVRRLYAAEIENLDDWFGKFVDAVAELGDADRTVICVSSDHGEMLGDHNDWSKSKPWEGSAHVPLACTGPPSLVKPRQLITHPVSTMDLAATWLDFARVQPARSGMTLVTSASLRGVLNGSETANRRFVASGLGRNATGAGNPTWNWRMVVKRVDTPAGANVSSGTALLKYICCESSCPGNPTNVPAVPANAFQELLYNVDTGADWAEMKPLAVGPSSPWASEVASMRQALPPAFAVGCQHAVHPQPSGRKFRLDCESGCVTVRGELAPHSAVAIDPSHKKCAVWSTTSSGSIVEATTGDVLMSKHGGVSSMCAPNASSLTVELGPISGSFSFTLINDKVESLSCQGLCLGVASTTELDTVNCTDTAAQGFKATPVQLNPTP